MPFVALGGLGRGWWSLNVMAMLLVTTLVAWLVDEGGMWRLTLATLLFVVGSSSVEFWWPGVGLGCLGLGVLDTSCFLGVDAGIAQLRIKTYRDDGVGERAGQPARRPAGLKGPDLLDEMTRLL